MSAKESSPIAFLFPAFPNLHQTFVLWEVLALRRRGIAIRLFSIKKPLTRTQQPEAAALVPEVYYLGSPFSADVLSANLRAVSRAPGRYLGLYVRAVREWWNDRGAGSAWKSRQISEAAPERQAGFLEGLQGRFNRSPLLFLLKSLWLIPVAIRLGEVLQERGIRRVHAHWASYSTTVALIMHWFYGTAFSFTAHAYDIYLVPRLLGVKVRDAEFAVTCAKVNKEFLGSLAGEVPPDRVVVNYHGVSLDRFQPVRAEDRAVDSLPTIVTCGRLEPYKGHHILLRAVARMSTRARCVLVGEGPQRGRLEELARELGIADRVEFTGPLPQSELVKVYARADLFVLGSVIAEGSGKRDVIPNVLAEAMAMQLPVVATNISGIAELITDGVSGRLVPANDPAPLAVVLDELLADPSQRERLAHGGREKVLREFDREQNIEELAALFRRIPA